MTATVPNRRTNADRSATTRRLLLDATIESLQEVGWARTSTTEVARRAGVSRGAQVHHFPTKEELVLAAVEHLLELRHAEFVAAFAELDPSDRSPLTAMRMLRERCFGPSFDPWLELLVAARTDPVLHARLIEVDQRFFENAVATYAGLFPELTGGDPEVARIGLGLAFTMLDGLAVQRLIGNTEADMDTVLQLFVEMATAAAPDGPAPIDLTEPTP